jgi:hypothetical protein
MLRTILKRLRWPLLGAGSAALMLVTTTALAGSGVGGVFNLGQVNTVDAQSTLTGNPAANPLFKLVGSGTAATIRAEAGSGIAINGISVSGTGQFGQSTSGYGLFGTHTGGSGATSGVWGQTSSTDASSAGVTGRNFGGGPGLQAIVTSNLVAPLKVNSSFKVTNLNADLLDGINSTRFWQLGGNAGTTPGTDFLGTTDNKALELKVNGSRALRLEPDATSPNLIGGALANSNPAANGAYGIVIAGGGETGFSNSVSDNYGTIGGGGGNIAGDLNADAGSAEFATVGGGRFNTASKTQAVVFGGEFNTASGFDSAVLGGGGNSAIASGSTVGGGSNNVASNSASFVGGGVNNTASGFNSVVPGGRDNTASGQYSFAAGRQAKATQDGSFVWADNQLADVTSPATNTFTVRAQNGSFFTGDLNVSTGAVTTAVGAIPDGATTPFISQGNVFTTANSAPTTITDFVGGAPAGQTITIVFFDANSTVTDGGYLLMNGNFVSSGDDTLVLVNTGGSNWYEVSRSVN